MLVASGAASDSRSRGATAAPWRDAAPVMPVKVAPLARIAFTTAASNRASAEAGLRQVAVVERDVVERGPGEVCAGERAAGERDGGANRSDFAQPRLGHADPPTATGADQDSSHVAARHGRIV